MLHISRLILEVMSKDSFNFGKYHSLRHFKNTFVMLQRIKMFKDLNEQSN